MHSLQLVQGPGSIRWRSNWDNVTHYYPRDVVRNNNVNFICILANVNSAPPSLNWDVFSPNEDYAGTFEQSTLPTTTQIPDGMWGFWYKTTTAQTFLVRNKGNALFTVEMTV